MTTTAWPEPDSYDPFIDRLAGSVIRRFCIPPWLATREDLRQEGLLACCSIAPRFDPERGQKFTTFIYPRVYGAMIDHLRRCHRQTLGLPPMRLSTRTADKRHSPGRRDAVIALRAGLSRLNAREILLIKDWVVGNTAASRARREGKNRSAITRETHRAMSTLRELSGARP